jgi:hypothetical protein
MDTIGVFHLLEVIGIHVEELNIILKKEPTLARGGGQSLVAEKQICDYLQDGLILWRILHPHRQLQSLPFQSGLLSIRGL